MKKFLLVLLAASGLTAYSQPLQRNTFTTNEYIGVGFTQYVAFRDGVLGTNVTNYVNNSVAPLVGTNFVNGQVGALGTNITNSFIANLNGFGTNLTVNGLTNLDGTYVAGPILSTSSSASNAPAQNELPSAAWVRNLLSGSGVIYYSTTNIESNATNTDAATFVYKFSTAIPAQDSRAYVNPTNNQYVGSVITTNTFQSVQGPVTVNMYMQKNSGGSTISVKSELYYTYDRTNFFGDYESQPQSVTTGSNLYSYVISIPPITSTNTAGFYIERRLKVVSVSGSPNLTNWMGSNTPSSISFSGPSSAGGQAFLAANQTFTGNNTFTGTNVNAVRIYGPEEFTAVASSSLTLANIGPNGRGMQTVPFLAGQSPSVYLNIRPEQMIGTNLIASFLFYSTNAVVSGGTLIRLQVTTTNLMENLVTLSWPQGNAWTALAGTNWTWISATGNIGLTYFSDVGITLNYQVLGGIGAGTNYWLRKAIIKSY